jgi:predicted flap endonuclease-1-like 5' DNA nuclease
MSYAIEDIEGIGPAYGQKLVAAGVRTTGALLRKCGHAPGRRAVSEQTGIAEPTLLKWVNLADLMRVSGIGPEFSELLEAAGVDTVKELRTRNAANLAQAMAETNARRALTRTTPGVRRVEQWIAAAGRLDPVVTY